MGRRAVYLSLEGRNYRLEDSNSIISSSALIHHIHRWVDDGLLLSKQANWRRKTRWYEKQEKRVHTQKDSEEVSCSLRCYSRVCVFVLSLCNVRASPISPVKTALSTGGAESNEVS